MQLQYFQLITDKTTAADLSSGAMYCVFAIFICVTLTIKTQNSLPFHKFSQKLANSDPTKEALNCIVSVQHLTALLTTLVSSRGFEIVKSGTILKHPQMLENWRKTAAANPKAEFTSLERLRL